MAETPDGSSPRRARVPGAPDDRRREAVRAAAAADGLGTAVPFLEAVAQQVARLRPRPGADPDDDRAAEPVRFARAHMLLAAARAAHGDAQAIDAPARALLEDPAMYAAFVQNVDLLYASRSPAADPVAFLLAAALDR